MSSGQLIGLAAAVILLGAIFAGCMVIRGKIRRFSKAAFGTESLTEGLERQADALAETPKSVSGMTRIFEPQIQRDFPDFNMVQFRNKAENFLVSAFRAITAGDAKMSGDVSADLRMQVENRVAANRAAGILEVYSNVRIHRTEITNYQKRDGKCIITFQSAVEHIHYTERDGKVLSGSRERKAQTKYNTELVYIQDETLVEFDNAVGTTCPHCGAPVRMLGNMKCEYCGLAVVPVNIKVWNLQKYYEVDYHRV